MRDSLEVLHDRYARALYLSAEEDGTVGRVMEEMSALNAEWHETKRFKLFLTHPLVSPDEKKSVVEKLFLRKKCCKTILNFLRVMIDNKRENLIHAVFLRYRDLYERSKEITRVRVETPRLLNKKQKKLLVDAIKERFFAGGKKEGINLELVENRALIGGLFIRFKDRIFDYSASGHLNNLKRGLIA